MMQALGQPNTTTTPFCRQKNQRVLEAPSHRVTKWRRQDLDPGLSDCAKEEKPATTLGTRVRDPVKCDWCRAGSVRGGTKHRRHQMLKRGVCQTLADVTDSHIWRPTSGHMAERMGEEGTSRERQGHLACPAGACFSPQTQRGFSVALTELEVCPLSATRMAQWLLSVLHRLHHTLSLV